MENAIEINGLIKHFGKVKAIDDLSMHVPAGKVYGFLGKNGSGKTTTIRIIMGLVKAEKGKVEIFGADMVKDRRNAVRNIGAIVETPGAYENLSAFDNLEITARMFNADKKRIAEVLEIVDLTDTADKKVGKFSLGMRQRLGIANSLIHSPKILILDEPTNGLDPDGIQGMRKLIRRLTDSFQITVLISSHLLSEVQQIADYIGIIDKGKLIEEADVASISTGEQNYLLLETDKIQETIQIIKLMEFPFEVDKTAVKVFCKRHENGIINIKLIQNNIFVYNLESVSKTLEERFLSITKENIAQRKCLHD